MIDIGLVSIARVIASRTFPGYPLPANRLFLHTAGVKVSGRTLFVPDGPWQVNDHSNRRDVAAALLDDVIPSKDQATYWRAHAKYVDQVGRPLHPHWRELMGDSRIGLPTGLGAFYRYGPNTMADAIIYRRHKGTLEFLLIKQKRSGKWGVPGGFIEPTDASPEAAAYREAKEETGLCDLTGRAEVLLRTLPIRERDTLNAWAEVVVVLIHAEQSYLQTAVPIAGDDASIAQWFALSRITDLDMLDTHPAYLRRAVACLS